MKIANWQLATLVFYKMISLDSDPALLLGLTDVTCGPCHACVSLNVLFCFICHIYPPFTRKRVVSLYFGRDVRTRLGVAFFEVYGPPVFHIKAGRPVKCLAQGHNKRTCRLVLHNLP